MEFISGHPNDHSNRAPGSGPFIELQNAQVRDGTLLSRVSFHERLDPFLTTGLFYARYDFTIESVPPSILSIPLLGLLVPLGWLTNAEIRFGEVDAEYLNSLPRVTLEFKKMFPQIGFSGRIRAEPVRNVSLWDPQKYCLLYSGGVDSTASLIRNYEKLPSTLTIWGAPGFPLQDSQYWTRFRNRTQPFLRALGVESHVVETNALDMVNQAAINATFKHELRHGWWEDLAFGLSLLSLSAPYTYYNQIGNLMISSSHTEKTQVPWGSSSMTDEKVKWGGLRVIHDSYDLERGEKIRQVLIPFSRIHRRPIPLKVCAGRRRVTLASNQLNCGQCFKCMVTEFTLILSGSDPDENGFDISAASLSALRRNLEAGELSPESDETSWKFIKENSRTAPKDIVSKHPGLREFLEWFADWDERPKKKRGRIVDKLMPPGSRRRDVARAIVEKRTGLPA